MYPWIRLFTTSFRASISKSIAVDEICETNFRCMPWDIDLFFEMNNGRILTLFDLGRFCLAIRTGLGKVLKNNGWGLVVAGSTVRYRRRVKVFDKVTMRSQVAGFEGRWIYVEQSMWVNGEATSSVLLRTGVTSKQGIVSTEKILDTMDIKEWTREPSEWLKSWVASEEFRPWPPAP
jgi:acyl-CoA thioesterase FadM